jgi:hypothetical protein
MEFLKNHLNLSINSKNNVICRANSGLKFLGHVVTGCYTVVDKHTTRAIMDRVSLNNAASYSSLPLVEYAKDSLNYAILEEVERILDNTPK